MTVYSDTLSETINISHTPKGTYAPVVTERLRAQDLMDAAKVHCPSLAETLTLHDALTPIRGVVLIERIAIDLGQTVNHHFNLTVSEQASFLSRLVCALPAAVMENFLFTATEVVQRAVSVMETLEIEGSITPAIMYHMSLAERIVVADVLAKFLGAEVIDTISITPAMDAKAYKSAQISESLTIHDALTPLFILRVTCSETLEISADDAVRMVFNAEINEAIEIAGAYLAPNGSVTTWVMNTRSGAVSEYRNYAFNSFARVGNKYLGASDDGLYELLGDNDDGDDIIATIRSGFAQWAGTHLGSIKGIYLAVRGEGDFVLRVITADAKTYNYTVTTQNGRNTKITTGKGLRSRYFAFELVSTGQDFDLDTLEFIPLIAARRV